MQVRLKVVSGSSAGKEIKIPTPKTLIGRGDECHLKPQSDAISRRHCEIVTSDKEVVVRDLGSRNGTLVNGQRIMAETVLLNGDKLKVGPLEFELVIEHTAAKLKRPQVKDIKDAAARTVSSSASSSNHDMGDVTAWLDEADTAAKGRRVADPDTRQFRIDETSSDLPTDAEAVATSDTSVIDTGVTATGKTKKEAPGKLPPRPVVQAKDSREAAADMLKKLFNRR